MGSERLSGLAIMHVHRGRLLLQGFRQIACFYLLCSVPVGCRIDSVSTKCGRKSGIDKIDLATGSGSNSVWTRSCLTNPDVGDSSWKIFPETKDHSVLAETCQKSKVLCTRNPR